MKKIAYVLIALIIAALFVSSVSAEELIGGVGGDRGIIRVYSNVDGAQADLYSISGHIETKYISGGSVDFYVYATGTPADRVVVSANGYVSNYADVSNPPSGEIVEYTVNLEEKPIGGSVGFIDVSSNIIGAKVELIDVSGNIQYTDYTDNRGHVVFAVYTTATPITTARISANGWNTQTAQVTMPTAGQTTDVVFPAQTQAPTVPPQTTVPPAPTQSPIGFAVFGLIGALGAAALLRRE